MLLLRVRVRSLTSKCLTAVFRKRSKRVPRLPRRGYSFLAAVRACIGFRRPASTSVASSARSSATSTSLHPALTVARYWANFPVDMGIPTNPTSLCNGCGHVRDGHVALVGCTVRGCDCNKRQGYRIAYAGSPLDTVTRDGTTHTINQPAKPGNPI